MSEPNIVQSAGPPARQSHLTNQQKLTLIAEKVHECRRCTEFIASTINHAPGEGDPHAKIVLVGEALGKTESEQGRPFVGAAGKLLDNILTAAGVKREDIYITNTCLCRPPNNRTPTSEEAKNCRVFLNLQLGVIQPDFIICLGACASQNLLGTEERIGNLRGKWHEYKGMKVLCTWHPSYALRGGKVVKQQIWQDLQLLLKHPEFQSKTLTKETKS